MDEKVRETFGTRGRESKWTECVGGGKQKSEGKRPLGIQCVGG
jgi:hypothetical protein